MKVFFKYPPPPDLFGCVPLALANSTDEVGEVLALENELAMDNDGWALLAPYGEHRKTRMIMRDGQVVPETFVQVFDEAAMDAVLANETSDGIFARIKRAFVKRPIYNGHPDIKLYAPETVTLGNEKLVPLGLNQSCRKTARGLEFQPLLSPDGRRAVEEDGCKFPSGLFLLKKTGKVREDGAVEVRPFKLASVGLTTSPNISGVDSLANAKSNQPAATTETKTENHMMKSLMIGWLAGQGIALANDATEQSVFDAFNKEWLSRTTNATALANDKNNLTSTVTTLTTARDAEKKRADDAVTALANEQTAFKAERKSRVEAIVDLRIAEGRLDVAGRDAKVTDLVALGNDKLGPELEALGKLPVKFKVTSEISGARRTDANPTTAAVALGNAMAVHISAGKTKAQAMDLVMKDKPELHAAYLKEGAGNIVL